MMVIKTCFVAFLAGFTSVGSVLAMDTMTAIKQCNSGVPAQITAGCTALINARQDTPAHLALAHSNRGTVYSNNGQYALAIADFNAALRLNPSSATTFYNRALSNALSNNYNGAIADFTQAIRLMPNYAKAYLDRGRVYKALGKQSLADADFKEAARLAH